MNIDDAFGTNLRAEDVLGREFNVVISNFEMQEMNDGKMKPVIQFEKATKGLVLNATRKETMKILYGKQTEDWIGKPIVICHGTTSFQGKEVGTIVIQGPPQTVPQAVAAPAQPVDHGIPDVDDSAPF